MLIEADAPVEAHFESGAPSRVGEIHDGRVLRVEAGRATAWIDLGPAGIGLLDFGQRKPVEGAALRAQITRDAQGGKHHGLRLRLEIPGASAILLPGGDAIEVPRALAPAARKALRARVERLTRPEEGWLLRSAAADLPEDQLADALTRLRDQAPPADLAPPRRVWAPGPERLRRWLEAAPDSEWICDDGETIAALRGFGLPAATRWPLGGAALLARYAEALSGALTPEAALADGGTLHLETVRALTAIDVDLPAASAILAGNLLAAAEVGRQVRLRGLAGVIVVDFPRMTGERDRRQVSDRLTAALAACRPPCQVLGFTRAGLLEAVRPREAPPWTRIGAALDGFLGPADRAP